MINWNGEEYLSIRDMTPAPIPIPAFYLDDVKEWFNEVVRGPRKKGAPYKRTITYRGVRYVGAWPSALYNASDGHLIADIQYDKAEEL